MTERSQKTAKAPRAKNDKPAAKPVARKAARKTGYSDAERTKIKREVIAWISEGKTLREYCRKPGSPGWVTVYGWKDQDPVFAERFAHAREVGFDVIAEEALHIADTPLLGVITTRKETGVEVKEEDMLGHRKLQIETRLKLLAKWSPKKYGDRVEQHVTGGMSITDVALTDSQRAALDRALDEDI